VPSTSCMSSAVQRRVPTPSSSSSQERPLLLSLYLSFSLFTRCLLPMLSFRPTSTKPNRSEPVGWLADQFSYTIQRHLQPQPSPQSPSPLSRPVSTLFRYLSVGLEKVVTSQAEQPSPGDKSALAAARSFMPFFAVLAMTNWIVELPRSHKWRLKHLSLEPASHTRLPHGHALDPSSGHQHRPRLRS